MVEKCAAYIQKELTYLADVSESKNRFVGGQNVQLGMSFLNQMSRTAAEQKQSKLAERLSSQFKGFEVRFGPYFTQQQQ
jgi:hypothetical protein